MKKKILIVDDEPDVLQLATMVLEIAGYEIFTSADSSDYEEMIEKYRPDLILLDDILPTLRGIELCKILTSDPKTRDIPIIVFSASGAVQSKNAALEAGAKAFLSKPFDIPKLISIVNEVMTKI